MKRLLRIALFASLCATPVVAQDEVIIENISIGVVGRPVNLDISGIPQVGAVIYVNDTLNITYFATDSAGVRTPALIELSSVPAGAMDITETSDSTAIVVLVQRGNQTLRVEIRPIDSIVVGFLWGPGQSQPEGTFHISEPGVSVEQLSIVYEAGFLGDPDRLVHADSVQVCAFIIQASSAIATNTAGCAAALNIAMGVPSPRVLFRTAGMKVRPAAVEAIGRREIETACRPIWCEVAASRRAG